MTPQINPFLTWCAPTKEPTEKGIALMASFPQQNPHSLENAEVLRQHEAHKARRARIWTPKLKPNPPAPTVERCPDVIDLRPLVKANRMIVYPWPKPLWMGKPIQFNHHVVAWLRHKLALENGERSPSERRMMAEITVDTLRDFPDVTLEDVMGQSRNRKIVHARQLIMYQIYRERLDTSFPEIGRFFGGRDHTTVMHAVRKMEAIHGKARSE